MKDPKITTDHDEIRTWIQSRGGVPQKVYNANALSDKPGLRIKFTNETLNTGRKLKAKDVPWEEFFRDFEKMHLAFVYDNSNENKSKNFTFLAREPSREESLIVPDQS